MKKIDYEELGKYFAEKATKEFGSWYSEETTDWSEDISQGLSNAYYNEETDLCECHIEVTKNGKQPLLINFYVKYVEDNDCEYYID